MIMMVNKKTFSFVIQIIYSTVPHRQTYTTIIYKPFRVTGIGILFRITFCSVTVLYFKHQCQQGVSKKKRWLVSEIEEIRNRLKRFQTSGRIALQKDRKTIVSSLYVCIRKRLVLQHVSSSAEASGSILLNFEIYKKI